MEEWLQHIASSFEKVRDQVARTACAVEQQTTASHQVSASQEATAQPESSLKYPRHISPLGFTMRSFTANEMNRTLLNRYRNINWSRDWNHLVRLCSVAPLLGVSKVFPEGQSPNRTRRD